VGLYKIYKGDVKDGKLVLRKQEEFKKAVRDFGNGEAAVALGKYEELVSKKQLGYYWGYLIKEVSIQTGHWPKELNKHFEQIFLSEGETIKDLEKPEFHNFTLQVIALMAEMDITIYYPDEVMIQKTIRD